MSAETPASRVEELHREHGDRIRRYLARLAGPADADDLLQEVFERAQRAIGGFRGDSRALTWLYRIATNVAIDRLRSAGGRAELERDGGEGDPRDRGEGGDATDERALDGEVDRKRMRECILRVVDGLPASQRAVILLGELRELSDREMADALGISLGAAKIRLHRARRALKAALESACTFERDEVTGLACAPRAGGLVPLARRR